MRRAGLFTPCARFAAVPNPPPSVTLVPALGTSDSQLFSFNSQDLHAVPMDLMPLVPLWCRAMQRMGTSKRSFVDFDQLMGATTGGFSLSPFTSSVRGEDDVAAYLVLRGKSTSAQAGQLHDLMAEMMLEAKLDDKEIFKQLVLESRAAMESRVQSGGHSVAAGRLDA